MSLVIVVLCVCVCFPQQILCGVFSLLRVAIGAFGSLIGQLVIQQIS